LSRIIRWLGKRGLSPISSTYFVHQSQKLGDCHALHRTARFLEDEADGRDSGSSWACPWVRSTLILHLLQ
jgi:hypothetical protein